MSLDQRACKIGHLYDPEEHTVCPVCAIGDVESSAASDGPAKPKPELVRLELLIPLKQSFRFVHEPIGTGPGDRFRGRRAELDTLAERILFSDGGSFLITGYRGVGKTSFVNQVVHRLEELLNSMEGPRTETRILYIQMNISRPLLPAELMHHIIRRIYETLHEEKIDRHLDPELLADLERAYHRTSVNMARKLRRVTEDTIGLGDFGPVRSLLKVSLGHKRTRDDSFEASFLGYEDKAAEHDVIRLSQRLSSGYVESQRRRAFFGLYRSRRGGRRVKLKVVFLFDELDKLDDVAPAGESGGKPFIDDLLGGLKNVFTTSGVSFIFVAGKNLYDRWLEEVGRGDSIYESIFSYDKYLPCLWPEVPDIFDCLVDEVAVEKETEQVKRARFDFRQYLCYRGRGIPRRLLRALNQYVRWNEGRPVVSLSPRDLRTVRFYADLQRLINNREAELFGSVAEETKGTELDKCRLGVYYLIDWMLRQGNRPFAQSDALAAAERMSVNIVPSKEALAEAVGEVIRILLAGDYLIELPLDLFQAQVGGASARREASYKVVPRRIAEMGTNDERGEQEPGTQKEDLGSIQHYRLLQEIGQGGMGTVYRAWDTTLKRQVAIKTMHAWIASDRESAARFRREAKLMSSLSHPGVVQYFDSGEDQGRLFLVMELLDGLELRNLLSASGRLSVPTSLAVAEPLADALQYVHEKGIFRNDVKPGNVYITSSGRVCLVDFGISKSIGEALTMTQIPMGTPYYMSPEQISGLNVDARSDVYSFGIMLYELVTGKRPFEGNEIGRVILAHLNEVPTAPSFWADLPSELDSLILKCLEKQPEARFQSMAELSASLLAMADGGSVRVNLGSLVLEAKVHLKAKEAKVDEATRFGEESGAGCFQEFAAHEPQSAGLAVPFEAPPGPVPEAPRTAPVAERQSYVLEFVQGVLADRRFSLNTDVITLGRSPDSDIVLDSDRVSRFHAELNWTELAYVIKDLNSVNGTVVNGKSLREPVVLRDGDLIQIGPFAAVFHLR